jgi:hypothetical protein
VAGLLVIDLAQRLEDRPAVSLLLGATLGLLTLMRSEFLVIGCIVACVPLLRRQWLNTARILVAMLVVVAPWIVRNTIEFGQPVGIISHPWREIWRGANANASGSGYDADGWDIWEGERFPHIVRRLDSIPVSRTFELQADAVLKDEAQAYIRNNPARWMMLGVEKMVMLWTIDPYYPKGRHPAYVIPTIITSLLILAGLVFGLRQRKPLLPMVLILACLTGLFGLTYVLPRYQTYVFTIGLPLIACLPLPTFAPWKKSRLPTPS